jgi:hypothetical protein
VQTPASRSTALDTTVLLPSAVDGPDPPCGEAMRRTHLVLLMVGLLMLGAAS